jgi:hypothetical protein
MAQLKLYGRDNSSKRTKGINDKVYTLHAFEASSEQKNYSFSLLNLLSPTPAFLQKGHTRLRLSVML